MAEQTLETVFQKCMEAMTAEEMANLTEEKMMAIMEWMNTNDNYKQHADYLSANIREYMLNGTQLPEKLESKLGDQIHSESTIKSNPIVSLNKILANLPAEAAEKLDEKNLETLQKWLGYKDICTSKSDDEKLAVATDLLLNGKEPVEMAEYRQIVNDKVEKLIGGLSEETASKVSDKQKKDMQEWMEPNIKITPEVVESVEAYIKGERPQLPSTALLEKEDLSAEKNTGEEKAQENTQPPKSVKARIVDELKGLWGDRITKEMVVDISKKDEQFLPFALKVAGYAKNNEMTEPFNLKNMDEVVSLYNAVKSVTKDFRRELEAAEKGEVEIDMEKAIRMNDMTSYFINDTLKLNSKDKGEESNHQRVDDLLKLGDTRVFSNIVVPEAKKYFDAQTRAVLNFSQHVDKNYENRTKEEQRELLEVVMENPKQTLALYLISAQNEEENKTGTQIFNKADLIAKLTSKEVQSLAAQIDINDLNGSLTRLGKEVKSSDAVSKRQGLGAEAKNPAVFQQAAQRIS